jgi:hypothetical protein
MLVLIAPSVLFAQSNRGNQMSLTLTPPLIQISIAPGSPEWKSSLRLVNGNPYPITIYARVVPFTPDGETGNPKFASFSETENLPGTLSSWVKVPKDPIVIRGDSTAEIPFSILVPADAPPGGHYAAILVGTEPEIKKGTSAVSIGSMLASLILVRVPGEVIEKGDIRDFYVTDSVVDTPKATFVIRFENSGNVHIVPRGEISIKNMWGKERGKILINDGDNFGNVLPNSTRKFEFVWTGEENAFEFGRYRAVATLSFGEEGKQSVYREIAFWIVPWKPITLALLFLVGFFWFASFAIRRYVRRALALERERLGMFGAPAAGTTRPVAITAKALSTPIVREMADLSRSRAARQADNLTPYLAFVRKNALFFLFVLSLLAAIGLIGWYFMQVLEEERAFRVEVVREG